MNSLRTDPPGERRLTLHQHIQGKYLAARVLAEFMRHFSNWSEVWDAYRGLRSYPPLRLRNGMTLFYGAGDDPLFLYREMFVEKPYMRKGFYEPAADQTVIDIGANTGWFAAFLQSRARGITVHCFEPGGAAIECLRANIGANEFGKSVFVYPCAVSDRVGTSPLAPHEHSYERKLLGNSELLEGADVVKTITLERALKITGAGSIDLMKIDVEGAEIEIVLGSGIDVWRSISRVALEYHEYLRPGCHEIVTRALRERGFRTIHSERVLDYRERGTIFATK